MPIRGTGAIGVERTGTDRGVAAPAGVRDTRRARRGAGAASGAPSGGVDDLHPRTDTESGCALDGVEMGVPAEAALRGPLIYALGARLRSAQALERGTRLDVRV